MIALAAALAAPRTDWAQPQEAPAIQPTDPALAAHCLSSNPGRLALTEDQIARIDAIRRAHPENTAERRAAILKVLTRTQWMVYWREAGIAAC
jgi:hypothetical protein